MRINLEQGINNCQLIYDTYSNDWISLKGLLHFVDRQLFVHKKTLILTDLFQETEIISDNLYKEIAQFLCEQQIYRLIGVGPQLLSHADKFRLPEVHFYENISRLLNSQLLETLHKNIIIIKEASSYETKKIVNRLSRKCTETILEIDLGAIKTNLDFFRTKLAKRTQLMATVKASAYGSGSFGIAHFLQYCQVEYLAVAYTDEGINLREDGIRLPIMVMNPSISSFDKLVAYNLEPVIYSMNFLKHLKSYLEKQVISIEAHIKIDTGMHRLGIMEKEIEELVTILQSTASISIKSIFSHLASSGTWQHRDYTHLQAKLFLDIANYVETKLRRTFLRHLLNTAGSQFFPEYQFDMVRIGIGLYGFSKKVQPHLKIANTLKTIISQIKDVPEGSTIGYERKGVTRRPSKIATLAIGYADGFRRALSNNHGNVLVNGKLAPIIGNVCMDMAMIDITDVQASEGDEVIIFGDQLPIQKMALALDTIVYEVLTNVSERVKRVYYKNLPFSR